MPVLGHVLSYSAKSSASLAAYSSSSDECDIESEGEDERDKTALLSLVSSLIGLKRLDANSWGIFAAGLVDDVKVIQDESRNGELLD